MKRVFAFAVAIILLMSSTALADLLMPASLTIIEEEAFMGDSSVSGVVSIPEKVSLIGKDAFSGTSLFALEIPTGAKSIGKQDFSDAAYILFNGSSTNVESLSGVQYIIGPDQSNAHSYAEEQGLEFVSLSALVKNDGLFYREDNHGLTLMSAADPDELKREISIPEKINGKSVTDVSTFAFIGCTNVQRVIMPDDLLQTWEQSEHLLFPEIEFIRKSASDPLVKSVTANMTSGTVGQDIIWTVEPQEDQVLVQYSYSLLLNGEVIEEETTTSPTYTYSTQSVGSYQLNVEVANSVGATGNGSSQILYIAVESMKMQVSETLQNGQDLTIKIQEVPGAIYYGVYLTEESTGKSLGYRSMVKPGDVVFRGYLLDKGTYRVSGYVYGNDFRYSVPTVKKVTVKGDKVAGPEIQDQASIYYGNSFIVQRSGADEHAVTYQFRYSDGSLSDSRTTYEKNGDIWVYTEGEIEKWSDGGALLLRRAVLADGAWTAWGPVAEIEVTPAPMLATPVVNAQETSEAGKDLTISFESVENADSYEVSLMKGYHPENEGFYDEDYVYGNSFRKGRTIVIPGYSLSAGQYTLRVWANSENGEYYTSNEFVQKIEITGDRPEAPTVSADKTEQYITGGTTKLTIQAPGAEAAYIKRVICKNGLEYGNYGASSISLDENGNGVYRDSGPYHEDYVGYTLVYHVTVLCEGIWSEFGTAEVLLKNQEPLPSPIIEAAETHQAGADYTFYVSPVEGANRYDISFYQAYSNSSLYSWGLDTVDPEIGLTVPGYYLTQGAYRLVVCASSSEHGDSETEISIRVTGNRPSAPTVGIDLDELHIKDRPVFSINTSGAEELIVFYGRSDYTLRSRGSQKINITGDETTWRYTISESYLGQDYSFSFAVKKDGIWSAFKEITKPILDLPPLQTPILHMKSTYDAGEDIVISFDPVENAQSYEYMFGGNYGGSGGSCSETEVLTYSGADYEPGTYSFELIASANSFASSTIKQTFKIIGSKTQWDQPGVSKLQAQTNENFTFEFDTANVDAIRYRVSRDYQEPSHYSNTINVVDDETKWTTSRSSAGNWIYTFSALINERWTAWTSPITIEVIEQNSVVLPSLDVPDSVSLGQDLTVTVGPMEQAQYYYVYLYNSAGTQTASRYIYTNTGGTVTFDGYGLTLGKNRIRLQVYTGNNWLYLEKQFTVASGSRPQAPEVLPETDVGRVNVRYAFTVNSSGADKIAIRYYREDNTNNISYSTADATEDLTVWYHSQGTSGTTWKYSFAIRKDGVWSPWSRSYSVSISDREQLTKATIHSPETLEAGQDLYVSFDAVDNAETYEMYLYKPDGSYSHWWDVTPNAQRRVMGYDLIPGTYRIVVAASSIEYEGSTSEKTIQISGVRSEAPDVNVSSSEVYSYETFTFVIVSTGAEEIAYRYTYDYGGYDIGILNVLTTPTVWDTSANSSRSYSFSALKDGKWSAWSTPRAITVIQRPALQIPEVSVQETISQGENLTITVGSVENVSYYYVYLYNNRGASIISRYLSEPGTTTISGYYLPVGSVRVEVYAYGNNNGSSQVSKNLTVIAATRPDAPDVIPPDSLTVQARNYYSFAIQSGDAERVAVRYFRIGSPNDLSYSEFNADTGASTSWQTYQYNSGNKYAYSFAVLKNGVWSEWSPFTIITIE